MSFSLGSGSIHIICKLNNKAHAKASGSAQRVRPGILVVHPCNGGFEPPVHWCSTGYPSEQHRNKLRGSEMITKPDDAQELRLARFTYSPIKLRAPSKERGAGRRLSAECCAEWFHSIK